MLVFHRQRAVCAQCSPLRLSLELLNDSGRFNEDIPSVLWQSSACLLCLLLYPTSVLTTQFNVQQSGCAFFISARDRKVLWSNKLAELAMIVTPLKHVRLPELDYCCCCSPGLQALDKPRDNKNNRQHCIWSIFCVISLNRACSCRCIKKMRYKICRIWGTDKKIAVLWRDVPGNMCCCFQWLENHLLVKTVKFLQLLVISNWKQFN